MKQLLVVVLLLNLVSCSTYRIAERHLDGKMHKADLELYFETLNSGAQVEYWDSKDSTKPALLLVHGFGATTKYQWYKQVKLLSKKYRVIAPNLNYFGRTIPDSTNYSVAGQVETLEALLTDLKLDTVSLFGVSYGGLVSVELASNTERNITEMVLFDTPVKFADSSEIIAVTDYFNVSSVEELFAPSEPEGINKLMYLATGKDREVPNSFLEEFHTNAYAYNLQDKRNLISSLLQQMEEFQLRDYQFDMPILLLWGSEDRVVPVKTGEQLADYFGENARLKIIEDAAHMPNMTHKREFNTIIEVHLGITKR